jgi:hypothetical protein
MAFQGSDAAMEQASVSGLSDLHHDSENISTDNTDFNVNISTDNTDFNVDTSQTTIPTSPTSSGSKPPQASFSYSPGGGGGGGGGRQQFPAAPLPPLEGDQLLLAVKNQIEFYLSAANLERDVYLCSLMDAERFVPIHKIMEFKKLRSLTTDEAVVIRAMSTSATCSLNEENSAVRAVGKPELKRNTIVLREIPSDTSLEAVRGIFESCEVNPYLDPHPKPPT